MRDPAAGIHAAQRARGLLHPAAAVRQPGSVVGPPAALNGLSLGQPVTVFRGVAGASPEGRLWGRRRIDLGDHVAAVGEHEPDVAAKLRFSPVTSGFWLGHAACMYSLIRPPSTGPRWIRPPSRSGTVQRVVSRSPRGHAERCLVRPGHGGVVVMATGPPGPAGRARVVTMGPAGQQQARIRLAACRLRRVRPVPWPPRRRRTVRMRRRPWRPDELDSCAHSSPSRPSSAINARVALQAHAPGLTPG